MTTPINARQTPLTALIEVGVENIGSGNGVTFKVPYGAYVTAVKANVATAFNSGTTTTLSVSDGTTTFISAEDAKTAGVVSVDVMQKFFPTGGTFTVSLAETGTAATAGKAYVAVQYVEVGRWSENLG